jgi:hypothetical protein
MPAFETLKTINVETVWAGEHKNRVVKRWQDEVLPAK